MKSFWMNTITVIAVITQLSSTALAAIPRTSSYGVDYYTSAPVDFAKIVPMESLRGMKYEDVASWIPTDMQDTDDDGRVFGKILSRGITSWFNSPAMKNSELVRSAKSVQEAVSADVSFGGQEEDSIKHSFKFKIQAEKSSALLNYTGLVNAQLSYDVSDSELKLEVRETIAANTDVVLSHIDGLTDRRDTVSLSFNF